MAAGNTTLTGMVLAASPIKEYDKRIELLTKERGRISAFAHGARKLNNPLAAGTIPFTFGEFQLYEGRNAYNLQSVQIKTYFDKIAEDFDVLCYASYFAEMIQYFTRENVEAPQELLLLYITCKALLHGQVPLPLIRSVFEMRMMQIQGEALELFVCLECGRTDTDRTVFFDRGGLVCADCAEKLHLGEREKGYVLSADALYALQFILTTPLEKLYSFRVSENVQTELERFLHRYLKKYIHHEFRSLSFIL